MPHRHEYIRLLIEWLTTLFYILIGGAVKLAYTSRDKEVNRKLILITFIFALFVGVIVNRAMVLHDMTKWSGIATALAALMGEGVVVYLLTNSNNIFRSLINAIFKIDVKNADDSNDNDTD